VVYPPQDSVGDVQQQNKTAMLGSQSDAVAAGLAEAGVDAVEVTVQGVTTGEPADGVLRMGDEIVAVDGTVVESTQAAVSAIENLPPGSRVTLSIRRGGNDRSVVLTTVASTDDPSTSRIGVTLSDVFEPPFTVNIDLGQDIGGPSAGLMFSLGIYDLLTPGPLTGGRYIAGTGTIDMSGTVGPIGGIQQKIAGAYANGATVFLVPADNCEEAGQSSLAAKLDLVEVSTMDGAVQALQSYDNGTESELARCGG